MIAALQRACRCKIDPNIIVALDWNAAGVTDLTRLPDIFTGSESIHAGSGAFSTDIGFGYVLKLYLGDRAYGGLNTITITTPLYDPYHWINVYFWAEGDPVNTMNARRWCTESGSC